MKPLYLTLFAVVGVVSTVFSQVPAQFTVNNLGTPQLNGTYVVQDPNADYPVYVNQTDPQYVLFASGPPPGLPFIPAAWRFSKFTGYTGTGSMSGLQKEDFYEHSSPSFQPLAPIFADMANFPVFRDIGGGEPRPGSPEATIQLSSGGGSGGSGGGGAGGSVIAEQAEQLNVGLSFTDGQWVPQTQ